jgi:hypothetical protein
MHVGGLWSGLRCTGSLTLIYAEVRRSKAAKRKSAAKKTDASWTDLAARIVHCPAALPCLPGPPGRWSSVVYAARIEQRQ